MIWHDPPYDSIMTIGIQDDDDGSGIDIGADSSSDDSEAEIIGRVVRRAGDGGSASGGVVGSQRCQSTSSYQGECEEGMASTLSHHTTPTPLLHYYNYHYPHYCHPSLPRCLIVLYTSYDTLDGHSDYTRQGIESSGLFC